MGDDEVTLRLKTLELSEGEGEDEGGWMTVGGGGTSRNGAQQADEDKLPYFSPLISWGIYSFPEGETSTYSLARKILAVAGAGGEQTSALLDKVAVASASSGKEKQLIVLRGLPGSGKSSLAAVLVALSKDGIVCSADDYFIDKRTGKYNFNPGKLILSQAHAASQENCRKGMEKGLSLIVVDNTNTMMWEMEPYLKMGIQFNYDISIFEVETHWAKDPRKLALKNSHGVPKAKITEMLKRFENVDAEKLISDLAKTLGVRGNKYDAPADMPMSASGSRPQSPREREKGPLTVTVTTKDDDAFMQKFLFDEETGSGSRSKSTPPPLPLPVAPSPWGSGNDGYGASPAPSPIPPIPNKDPALVKGAKTLHAYFPTCPEDSLLDFLEKSGGPEWINEAMGALLDSGYEMAQEVVLPEEVEEQEGAVGGTGTGWTQPEVTAKDKPALDWLFTTTVKSSQEDDPDFDINLRLEPLQPTPLPPNNSPIPLEDGENCAYDPYKFTTTTATDAEEYEAENYAILQAEKKLYSASKAHRDKIVDEEEMKLKALQKAQTTVRSRRDLMWDKEAIVLSEAERRQLIQMFTDPSGNSDLINTFQVTLSPEFIQKMIRNYGLGLEAFDPTLQKMLERAARGEGVRVPVPHPIAFEMYNSLCEKAKKKGGEKTKK